MVKKKGQTNNHKVIGISVVLLLCATLVLGATIFYPVLNPEGNTENTSFVAEYNFTETNLKELKWSFNGTNTTIFDDSVVLMMNFDNRSALGENDTHVFDISGNGNNGTVVGGAIWNSTGGKYNGAFEFDRVDDYISISNSESLNMTDNITISFWINVKEIRTDGSYPNVLYKKDVFGFYYSNSDSRLGLSFRNTTSNIDSSTLTTIKDFERMEYQHVVFVYSTSGGQIYLNSNLNTSFGYFGSLNNSEEDFNIMGRGGIAGYQLSGSIDDLLIMNKSLSSSEVSKLYESQLTKYDSENWSFQTNETMNTNTTGISYDYYLCSTDSSDNENCTTSKTITRIPERETITGNFSSSIKTLPSKGVYGASNPTSYFGNDTGVNRVDTTGDGSFDATLNRTWHKEKWLNSNMGWQRTVISYSSEFYSNTTDDSGVNWTGGTNYDNLIETVKWQYENGGNVLLQIRVIPNWLVDNSSGLCNGDTLNEGNCTATNYTKYANIIDDAHKKITNNYEYDNVYYELINEPYFVWNVTKYIQHFNDTYNAMKLKDSRLRLGGPSGYLVSDHPERRVWTQSFLGNISNLDFISIHSYTGNEGYFDDELISELNQINCSQTNCSKIFISEWNTYSVTDSDSKKGAVVGSAYMDGLNYNQSVEFMLFQWDSGLNSTNQVFAPIIYDMVSEPRVDNILYPSYNITKNFATYHSAGSTVYTSSSSDSKLKTVSTKKDDQYALTIINTDTEARNITVDLSGAYPYETITNAETGEEYTITSGLLEPIVLDSYEILYLYAVSPNVEPSGSSPTHSFPPAGIPSDVTDSNIIEQFIIDETGVDIQCKQVGEECNYFSGDCCGTSTCSFWSGKCVEPKDDLTEEEVKGIIENKSFFRKLSEAFSNFFRSIFKFLGFIDD